ncbi:MAG: 8-oxo-dGTP pyrophosphatase MutT (NUDIX family) [Paracoccaceae bacterium]|jgi:8-oxo-dGTP pyrophosphatase MutT (NUDIX family)
MQKRKKVLRKTGETTQYAALCFRTRKDNKCEVLLVTSRKSGRWIVPKGWPLDGKTPEDTAAQEAFEEAGVKGKIHDISLGRYRYNRENPANDRTSAEAFIFPLEVKKLSKNFKEKGQRKIKWFSPKKAAMLVREPKLARIIRSFDPKDLKTG